MVITCWNKDCGLPENHQVIISRFTAPIVSRQINLIRFFSPAKNREGATMDFHAAWKIQFSVRPCSARCFSTRSTFLPS